MRTLGVVLLVCSMSVTASAQGYQIRRTDTQSSQTDYDGTRTTIDQRQTRNLGRAQVDLLGEQAQDIRTRIQWAGAGWGILDHFLASAFFERDLHPSVTLRLTGVGGFTSHDHGREFYASGEVHLWLHTRRLEYISESLLLDYSAAGSSTYDGYGDDRSHTSEYHATETRVEVPGFRSRMIGAEIGGGVWNGWARTRELPTSREERALSAYGYIGFASGWIKSSLYRVEGYGLIGNSRYHRAFVHLMYAPLTIWSSFDVDRDNQPSQFPVGLRAGLENLYGRTSALMVRVELMAIPAGGLAMVLLTVGFGSMFPS